ncbi:hypothetical protein H0H81_000804 [Sphagnurus paluster]|uniref:Ribosomal protein S6 n=1 Tax=Sphagnurus paluster TaxID=117069 RepID=A0A9P7FMR8_9AGAR|nr:hypothetical protein H0H81_000804 [Sphagnurus paluster]
MPFYQMLCITTHVSEYKHIKELVRQTATHVMNAGGVVRGINSLGTLTLPQRMRRHKAIHSMGDYWTIHFDTAPRTLRSLNSIMRRDPRVIRWTVLKLGDKVEDIAVEGQKALRTDSPLQDLIN